MLFSGKEFVAVVGNSVVSALIIMLAENSSHSSPRGICLEVERFGKVGSLQDKVVAQVLLQLLEGTVTPAVPDDYMSGTRLQGVQRANEWFKTSSLRTVC